MQAAVEPLFAAARRATYEGEQLAASFQLMVDLGADSEPTPEALEQVQAIANFVASRALSGPSLPADRSLFWGGREGAQLRLKPENLDDWMARAIHFVVNVKRVGDHLQIEITGLGPTKMMEEQGRVQ